MARCVVTTTLAGRCGRQCSQFLPPVPLEGPDPATTSPLAELWTPCCPLGNHDSVATSCIFLQPLHPKHSDSHLPPFCISSLRRWVSDFPKALLINKASLWPNQWIFSTWNLLTLSVALPLTTSCFFPPGTSVTYSGPL